MQKPIAPTDARRDRVVGDQEVDGTGEVTGGPIDRQVGHQLAGLVRVVRRRAAVQVGRERDEALSRQPVGDARDVVGQPPPLLDHDDAGAAAGLRHREVAVGVVAVAGELDVLARVVVADR